MIPGFRSQSSRDTTHCIASVLEIMNKKSLAANQLNDSLINNKNGSYTDSKQLSLLSCNKCDFFLFCIF